GRFCHRGRLLRCAACTTSSRGIYGPSRFLRSGLSLRSTQYEGLRSR
ncbi:hypothetical protein CSUI_004287, partial [Cystoisospora suis]